MYCARMRAVATCHSKWSGPALDLACEKGGPVYEGGSQDATAAQPPASVRIALCAACDGGFATDSRIWFAKCCTRRAWLMGDSMVGEADGG